MWVGIEEYDFDRVTQDGYRLDQQVPRPARYLFDCDPAQRWQRGRATVPLSPVTHVLLWSDEKRNIQDVKQGLVRVNFYNT